MDIIGVANDTWYFCLFKIVVCLSLEDYHLVQRIYNINEQCLPD